MKRLMCGFDECQARRFSMSLPNSWVKALFPIFAAAALLAAGCAVPQPKSPDRKSQTLLQTPAPQSLSDLCSDSPAAVGVSNIIGFTTCTGNRGYECGFLNSWLRPIGGYRPGAAIPGQGHSLQTYIFCEHWAAMPPDNRFALGLAEGWGPNCVGGGIIELLCRKSTNAPAADGQIFCTPLVMDGYNRVAIARLLEHCSNGNPNINVPTRCGILIGAIHNGPSCAALAGLGLISMHHEGGTSG
jgi:hypothetical protein